MRLYFAKNELKEWVQHVLAFGIFKLIIEDHNNLLEYLFFFIMGIIFQVLALILAPISLIITLLMAVKIK